MRSVHVLVPDGIDDPTRPTGGNVYDRQVCDGLAASGWSVREHAVPGSWPWPEAEARSALAATLAAAPDGAVLLADGLVASTAPEVLVPEARRLRLVVLVHMPLDGTSTDAHLREGAVLSAAAAVVTTSRWTRRRLLARHGLDPGRVYVAEPGVAPAALARGTSAGGRLLCVAAVTPGKGHDVLLAGLAHVRDLPWRLVCAGSVDIDPDLVERLRARARESGIAHRVRFAGALVGDDLDAAYAATDALVLASRAETYGLVVVEALARGVPVIGTAVGGLPEALGSAADGTRPGLLVPPDDPAALGDAVRLWLTDAGVRNRLRRAADDRRTNLSGWSHTVEGVSRVLSAVGVDG